MGALLKLLGRQPQSQALIQAPSMDLIKSDNEFLLPEPMEIVCELESEKLAGYAQTAKDLKFANEALGREKLLHILKTKNFKVYDHSKVNDFMGRYIKYKHETLKLGDDIGWQWIELQKYRHPLPVRVVENIKSICCFNAYEYPKNSFSFFVSDIVLVTSRYNPSGTNGEKNTGGFMSEWEVIPMKRKTEICFLKVVASTDSLLQESLIIDAWRGPTFSDEEAKI